ncbi:MAG: hypothetical protein COW76_20870 [Shewanella sp. CG18_big_fil_WC_8_21_14_2_50_42_11]|jgi:hypothetical protein|nr:MAG: hypothetical protein COW76_20870 [Shewanella sp. CG18_big_fil_WC_8_21_14_2_50_42_11]PIX72564.1 MAG: hypothetical protein COZ42_05215 [Shewanella sp. CG_4_10_14_3_um_filter_42_91]PIY64559.1 MAG: hypothetical protein COY92_15655 [Shewanella sp. CG_4_10_14_0_8_um_filter_42_13]PJB93608.1 MAG: hypothetical protein CO084_00535 [Shewanella sp. CG_4_9_14_0_8_um_filter_42_14]RPA33889.1 hypothetical protein EGC79_20105 [Shewanella vesiculosa]|tara:strand:+ start:204 stop:608 length:405 start_codon:yes stop_codon:yes gene_type:complete
MNKSAMWIFTVSALCASMTARAEDAAEKAFTDELIECAAYYQISSEAIGAMNAPQMKAVGDRLKTSAVDAVAIAGKYRAPAQVEKDVIAAKQQQIDKLAGSNNLGGLMAKYKDSCKSIVTEPQKRLDYWTMATM